MSAKNLKDAIMTESAQNAILSVLDQDNSREQALIEKCNAAFGIKDRSEIKEETDLDRYLRYYRLLEHEQTADPKDARLFRIARIEKLAEAHDKAEDDALREDLEKEIALLAEGVDCVGMIEEISEEKLEELKRSTLASYAKKAHKRFGSSQFERGSVLQRKQLGVSDDRDERKWNKHNRIFRNKRKGLDRAINRLATGKHVNESNIAESVRPNPVIDSIGIHRHYNEKGELHRDDGPAKVSPTGTKEYYQNGLLHRDDGPAIEHASGTKTYYQNGKIHRTGGPAVEYANGVKEYWENGRHLKTVKESIEQLDELKRSTLASYAKMAHRRLGDSEFGRGAVFQRQYLGSDERDDDRRWKMHHRILRNKRKGLDRAINRLTTGKHVNESTDYNSPHFHPGTHRPTDAFYKATPKEHEKEFYNHVDKFWIAAEKDKEDITDYHAHAADYHAKAYLMKTKSPLNVDEREFHSAYTINDETDDGRSVEERVADYKKDFPGFKVPKISPTKIKKHYKPGIKESIEQLDELKRSTLASYAKKAREVEKQKSQSAIKKDDEMSRKFRSGDATDANLADMDRSAMADYRTAYLRRKGLNRAHERLTAGGRMTESADQNPHKAILQKFRNLHESRNQKG